MEYLNTNNAPSSELYPNGVYPWMRLLAGAEGSQINGLKMLDDLDMNGFSIINSGGGGGIGWNTSGTNTGPSLKLGTDVGSDFQLYVDGKIFASVPTSGDFNLGFGFSAVNPGNGHTNIHQADINLQCNGPLNVNSPSIIMPSIPNQLGDSLLFFDSVSKAVSFSPSKNFYAMTNYEGSTNPQNLTAATPIILILTGGTLTSSNQGIEILDVCQLKNSTNSTLNAVKVDIIMDIESTTGTFPTDINLQLNINTVPLNYYPAVQVPNNGQYWQVHGSWIINNLANNAQLDTLIESSEDCQIFIHSFSMSLTVLK